MANEINASSSLSGVKNGIAAVNRATSATLSQSGKEGIGKTFPVPTTAALIDFGAITGAPAYVQIKNNDPTNYIEIGGDSGLTVFKLKVLAGGIQLISPSSGTVYWKANTAIVPVQMDAVEA